MGMPPPYSTEHNIWSINKPADNPIRKEGKRVLGRNSMCPCGSRIKFKRCHGA